MKTYRVCKRCKIHHYEDCETCLGFGLKAYPHSHENVPIIAAQAIHFGGESDEPLPEWKPCPECGSTPSGVPAVQIHAVEGDKISV